jgi:hypothetical protein
MEHISWGTRKLLRQWGLGLLTPATVMQTKYSRRAGVVPLHPPPPPTGWSQLILIGTDNWARERTRPEGRCTLSFCPSKFQSFPISSPAAGTCISGHIIPPSGNGLSKVSWSNNPVIEHGEIVIPGCQDIQYFNLHGNEKVNSICTVGAR